MIKLIGKMEYKVFCVVMNLGENRVLEEFKISIDGKGKVNGFMRLVYIGKVELKGQIREFNDRKISEVKAFPIELHIKFRNTAKENENIVRSSVGFNSAKQYLKGKFEKSQKIKEIQIFAEPSFLHISTWCDSAEYEWRAGESIENIEILESGNIPFCVYAYYPNEKLTSITKLRQRLVSAAAKFPKQKLGFRFEIHTSFMEEHTTRAEEIVNGIRELFKKELKEINKVTYTALPKNETITCVNK